MFGALAVTALSVALTQRPRPEYIYGMTVGIVALSGLCVAALSRSLKLERWTAPLALGAGVVFLVAFPTFYHPSPRPLHDALRRLEPVRRALQQPSSVLVASGYNFEICAYLAETYAHRCTSPDWSTVGASARRLGSANQALLQAKATVVYADPPLQADPLLMRVLASPRSTGWRQVAAGTGNDGRWSVLMRAVNSHGVRVAGAYAHPPHAMLDHLPGSLNDPRLAYYSGIYLDGWLQQRATVVLSGGRGGTLIVRIQVLPHPKQRLRILINGRLIASRSVSAGPLELRVPVSSSPIERRVDLQWAAAAPISPNDLRPATGTLGELGVQPLASSRN